MNLGRQGERHAARFLRRLGWKVVERNYSCPVGEVDLVAIDADTIVFVEVKARRHTDAADPEANVTFQKRRRLSRAAQHYLNARNAQHQPCRFDVISVVLPERGKPEVEHFIDAFEAVLR